LKTGSHTYTAVKNSYGPSEARKFIDNVPLYWGKQPGTSGPVYIGAVVVFLFVLGMFLVKGPVKWWLFTVTVISIVLSWGHNFSMLTNFMLDYFPGYNKFRSVSMTLIMAEFAMPVLAILTLKEIITRDIPKKELMNALKYSLFGLGGLILLLLLISGSFDMSAPVDEQLRSQGLGAIVDAIQLDRLSLLRSDAFRSLVLVCLTAGVVYLAYLKKIKFNLLIVFISLLLLVDLWPVDKRYLSGRDFISKKEDKNPFKPSTADLLILQDKTPDYRVLNLTVSPLQDGSTSYFHKSLGGYHGAKMRRYQEFYENVIQNEIMALTRTRPVPQAFDSTFATFRGINMLNTRYIIYSPDAPPLVNKHELGNAWFVNRVKVVNTADEEMASMSVFNPKEEAVVSKNFETLTSGFQQTADSTAKIALTEYKPNYLKYATSAQTEQLAVFSEIYYDKGWQAYVDGKLTPHFRADYILRAMRIPAGNHVVEFKFHPKSYFMSEKVSMACSVLLILLILGTGYLEWKKGKTVKNAN